jgi:hypothetical protein
MRLRVPRSPALFTPAFAVAALLLPLPAEAATTVPRFTGRIAGIVKGAGGVAQMGATVQLLNRFEKPILRVMTDERGAFAFDSLSPECYSIRVSFASFMPATRANIQIGPGIERFLAIQLTSLFSSVEVFYAPPPGSFLMSEDWRATLRGSISTRPILRALPTWKDPLPHPSQPQARSLFSDTRAIVQLSGGDTVTSFAMGSQPDLGTAFAVGASFAGRNQVQFSGNLGYGLLSGIPAAGFRTSYQRLVDSPLGLDAPNPQVSLTVRQLFLPTAQVSPLGSRSSGAPVLRSVSSTFFDRWRVADNLLIEYGAALDSVQFYERLNYLSPFARLTVDGGGLGSFRAAYSSGLPPVDLLFRGAGEEAEMQRQLSGLALFPRVTRRSGATQTQRVQNLELGYTRKLGSGELFASAYQENTTNAGIATFGASENLLGIDLVPDLATNADIFNIGGYRRNGFLAGWSQQVIADWRISTAYGLGGILRTDQRSIQLSEAQNSEAASIRSGISRSQKSFASVKISGSIPRAGTRLYSSYLWTDYRALTPFHTSLTTPGLAEAGLNLGVRQPIPAFLGLPGRLELNAEVRNMLEQGYIPVQTPTGRTMWLIPTPKQLRGGLSFIF